MRSPNPTIQTPLLPMHQSTSQNDSRWAAFVATSQSAGKVLLKGTRKTAIYGGYSAYHLLDFLRIALVSEMLMGRWLNQFFVELDRYNWAPSAEAQRTWVGWPIIGITFSLALIAKLINQFAKKKKGYLAAQDYLFTVFSSSILYLVLDSVSETGNIGHIPIWLFAITSAAVPVLAAISMKQVIPDSSDKLMIKPSEYNDSNFPKFPTATRSEKIFNVLNGVGYGACVPLLFWLINRASNQETVGMEAYQSTLSALSYVAYSAAGYFISDAPKTFNTLAAGSKSIINGVLCYGSLSGIAYHTLTRIYECQGNICWEKSTNGQLTNFFIPLAIVLGLYAGATTLFDFNKSHTCNVEFLDSMEKKKDAIVKHAEKAGNTLASAYSIAKSSASRNSTALFNQCTSCCDNDDASTTPLIQNQP